MTKGNLEGALRKDSNVSRLNEVDRPLNRADGSMFSTDAPPLEVDPILTPSEAAAYLRISVATLLPKAWYTVIRIRRSGYRSLLHEGIDRKRERERK